MDDLIAKLEAKDTTSGMKSSETYLKESDQSTTSSNKKEDEDENWKKSDRDESWKGNNEDVSIDEKKFYRGTRHSLSFDFGTNNYLSGDGTFPDAGTDLYTVRPWGSWYGAINSVYRTRLSRVFFLEWGIGASMYNFKFQNDAVTIGSDPTTVTYTVDTRPVDFIKSKLSATYVNASFVPVIDFGGNRHKPVLFDGRRSDSFRIGFGPYAGYRIDSYSRKVFENEEGDKRKERDHDTFHLNNFRYGLRLQLGFKDTDIFFNYDLNDLFVKDKGPQLNAFSFGFSF
jgi:hypothetical protein